MGYLAPGLKKKHVTIDVICCIMKDFRIKNNYLFSYKNNDIIVAQDTHARGAPASGSCASPGTFKKNGFICCILLIFCL